MRPTYDLTNYGIGVGIERPKWGQPRCQILSHSNTSNPFIYGAQV